MRFLPLWLRRLMMSQPAPPVLRNTSEHPVMIPGSVRGTNITLPPQGLVAGTLYARLGLRELQLVQKPTAKQLRDAKDPQGEVAAYLRASEGGSSAVDVIEGRTSAQWAEHFRVTDDAALLTTDYGILMRVAALLCVPVKDARSKLSVIQSIRKVIPYVRPEAGPPTVTTQPSATVTPPEQDVSPLNVTRS